MPLHLRITAAVLTELLLFFIIGGLLPVRGEDESLSVTETLCAGFLLEYTLLEAAALICTFLALPLTTFSGIWAGILGLLAAASLVLHGRENFRALLLRLRRGRPSAALAVLVLAALGLTVLSVLLRNGVDTTGIIAQMNTDIYTDSLSLTDGRTGEILYTMTTGAFINRYYVGSEFFALLFHIPALTQMKLVQQSLTVLLFLMISARILSRLFGGDRVRVSAAMLLLMLLVLTTAGPYSPQYILLTTGWTGNALLVGILLPSILLLLLMLCEQPQNRSLYLLLLFSGICAVSLSETALILVPLALFAGVIPVAVLKKEPNLVMHLILWLVLPLTMAAFCGYLPGGGAL